MKRFRFTKTLILILLTAVLAASLPVSAGTEVRTVSPVSVNKSRTLNVLFIGNSLLQGLGSADKGGRFGMCGIRYGTGGVYGFFLCNVNLIGKLVVGGVRQLQMIT